jgi:hypothetical protein
MSVQFSLQPAQIQTPVDHAPFHTWGFPDGTPWTEFYRLGGGYLLRFPELAEFEVAANGLEVTCIPAPDVSEATTQHLYLNQVLPLVLSKLGKLVFHASAVEVAGGPSPSPPSRVGASPRWRRALRSAGFGS